eukprot:194758-Pyramimonas_sp.AAC.1
MQYGVTVSLTSDWCARWARTLAALLCAPHPPIHNSNRSARHLRAACSPLARILRDACVTFV